MTGDTYFVAFGIFEICAIVGWRVLGPESWRSLRVAAVTERHRVDVIYDRPPRSQKCCHLPVPRFMGAASIWLAKEEQRPLTTGALPACPWTTLFAESFLQAKSWQYRTVESERTLEIRYANEDVGKHLHHPRIVVEWAI